MQRDHRYPYGRGPRRGIYDRLGPPPLPLADQALGRPGAAPHRVLQPESAYPTPCIPTMSASVRVSVRECVFNETVAYTSRLQ